MIQDFLRYLQDEEGMVVVIFGFGIIPLGLFLFLFDALLKAIGLRKFSETLANLLAFPIALTWIGGFATSMILMASGVNPIKSLLIIMGIFIITLLYVALNYNEVRTFMDDKKTSVKNKVKEASVQSKK